MDYFDLDRRALEALNAAHVGELAMMPLPALPQNFDDPELTRALVITAQRLLVRAHHRARDYRAKRHIERAAGDCADAVPYLGG